VRRATIPALVIVVGVLLLADMLVVNASLADLAGVAVDAAILVAAGAALAALGSLAARRAGDLWRRRGDPVGAALVLAGMGAILVAGLRPGAIGAGDPAVGWLLAALLVPIGASLFGLLFVTTLAAAHRSMQHHGREGVVLVGAATVVLVLLLPLGGAAGGWLSGAAGWLLAVPIGAVFRGILIGVAILAGVLSARTMLGVGASDE
jgi:MFS transporter, CP family, cyanate transporter